MILIWRFRVLNIFEAQVTKEDFYQFFSEMHLTVDDKARWHQISKFIFTFSVMLQIEKGDQKKKKIQADDTFTAQQN